MKTLIAALAFMTSLVVSAQSRIVSVDAFDLTYTAGLMIKHDKGRRSSLDRDETNFRFNLNYAQTIPAYVGPMWKAKVYINRTDVDRGSDDVKDTSYGLAGGILHNFQAEKIKDSVFAGALLGIERGTIEQNGLDDKSGFNFYFEFEGGKRWDLGKYSAANISYSPSVVWNWKRYGGDIRDVYFKSGYELRFNFLKFDILF